MMDDSRLAYLAALEIPVWVSRHSSPLINEKPTAERIHVGPGTGGTLMICAGREQSSSNLASDIARVFPEAPVWAWPEFESAGVTAAEAIQESLFTCLVVFGHALAERLFVAEVPEQLGPARVVVADDLDVLLHVPGARLKLWQQLCAGGVVTER